MAEVFRKLLGGGVVADSTLNDRQIRVIASTPTPDRDGDIVEPSGCDLRAYRKNPIVLMNHDRAKAIGTFAPQIFPDRIEGVITFAPRGISATADEACALAKAGVLAAVSVGFRATDSKPLGGYGDGKRFSKWELLEVSLVSLPANPDALVISRQLGESRKSGRVLSRENANALSEVRRCLDKSASAHDTAISELEKADQHRASARRHAARIAANAGDDDGDVDQDDEDGADVELSAALLENGRERRARQIKLAEAEFALIPEPERRASTRTLSSFCGLESADVGRAELDEPSRELGGAHHTAQVRRETEERMRALAG